MLWHEVSMKKITIISAMLLSLTANLAFADTDDHPRAVDRHDRVIFADRDDHDCRSSHCVSAPEINPGQAMGALSLLAGSLAIIRGYRRKKK
jgi:hypothetical protein